MDIKRILVPLDGSRFAEWALTYAVGLAQPRGAAIELVSVYEDQPTVGGWPLSAEQVEEWFERYLAEVSDRIRRTTQLEVRREVRGAPVAEAVEEAARQKRADLVVLSTHGRGTLSRAWLGSVADHVSRHVEVPVLMVRPEEETAPPARATTIRSVIVALDGSPRAERALDAAIAVTGKEAAYRLVRVVPPHWVTSPYLPHAIADARRLEEEERSEALQYLEQLRERLAAEGLCVETDVFVGVHPAAGILHASQHSGADMVAIGSHGRSPLGKVLMGSVADKILRAAHLPVLLVRGSE